MDVLATLLCVLLAGPVAARWQTLSVGLHHTCALRASDASPVCWGETTHGQTEPPPDLHLVTISAGDGLTCGVKASDSALVCWGRSILGAPSDLKLVSVSVWKDHACGIRVVDLVPVCWGSNSMGQSQPPAGSGFQAISVGMHHSCAIQDRVPLCWGDNSKGQSSPPRDLEIVAISAGSWHTCGIRLADQVPVCWGFNQNSQCRPPPGLSLSAIGAGDQHSCGLVMSSGVPICWGANANSQSSPPSGLSLASIGGGAFHTCGLKVADATPVCWGSDSDRQSSPPVGQRLICASGHYSAPPGVTSLVACRRCAAGSYSDTRGASTCALCLEGRYAGGPAAGSCQPCSAGRFADRTGESACKGCALGRFSVDVGAMSSTACSLCHAGSYAGRLGASSCSTCNTGRFGTAVGATNATACESCPAGRFRPTSANGSSCKPCGPGQYSAGGSAWCLRCEVGRYNDAFGGTSSEACLLCGIGRYSTSRGSSNCEPCLVGRTSIELGASRASDCVSCGRGRYGDVPGAQCKGCAIGRFSASIAATSAAVCEPCGAGRFAQNPGASSCQRCVAGRYSGIVGAASDVVCKPCQVGRFGGASGATDANVCELCTPGRYSRVAGASVCLSCALGSFSAIPGSSVCGACDLAPSTPSGARACCPARDREAWSRASTAFISLPPGKSHSEVHVIASREPCFPGAGALGEKVVIKSSVLRVSNQMFDWPSVCVATMRSGTVHDSVFLRCGDEQIKDGCRLGAPFAISSLFQHGDDLTFPVYVGTSSQDEMDWQRCDAHFSALVQVKQFGCAPDSLLYFAIALTAVVCATVSCGLVLECLQRARLRTFVEVKLDIALDAAAEQVLPTREDLHRSFLRGLDLHSHELPIDKLRALTQPRRGLLEVEFLVLATRRDGHALRRRLLLTGWVPATVAPKGWGGVTVQQRSLALVKTVGQASGEDVVDIVERCADRCCASGGEADDFLRRLHLRVAHRVLDRLATRWTMMLLCCQCVVHLLGAGLLPALAYWAMEHCGDGYPVWVHGFWAMSTFFSISCSVCWLVDVGGPDLWPFVRCHYARLALRIAAMVFCLVDTYQDATFPVIAKRCHFDLWFVSAWLVAFGIGIMQAGTLLAAVLVRIERCRLARTPDEQERQWLEAVFVALRGTDNFLLVFVVRPAMEERLGGRSSWSMRIVEARAALFRFLFEDVEQGVLMATFIAFYEEATSLDKVWLVCSLVTSMLLSFTLVVQYVPEVRAWLWHRILAQLPGCARCRVACRLLWLLALLILYRAISSLPWIWTCAPSGMHREVLFEVVALASIPLCGLLLLCVAIIACQLSRSKRRRRLPPSAQRRRHVKQCEPLRPKRDEEFDLWLSPAMKLCSALKDRRNEIPCGASREAIAHLQELVDEIDVVVSRNARQAVDQVVSTLASSGDTAEEVAFALLRELRDGVDAEFGAGAPELEHVTAQREEVARALAASRVRRRVLNELKGGRFQRSGLIGRANRIHDVTEGLAPLRLLHWRRLEAFGRLPVCGEEYAAETVPEAVSRFATERGLSESEAAGRAVVFFFSHRWLKRSNVRDEEPASCSDDANRSKAKGLVAFAKWYSAMAESKDLPVEVMFWIDVSCTDQSSPSLRELNCAALPLYIAASDKVVVWRTPDFDRHRWSMIERLLAYAHSPGGLTPYAIGSGLVEAAAIAAEERTGTWQVFVDTAWRHLCPEAQSRLHAAKARDASEAYYNSHGARYQANLLEMVVKPAESDDTLPLRFVDTEVGGPSPSVLGATADHMPKIAPALRTPDAAISVRRRSHKLMDPMDVEGCPTKGSDRYMMQQLVMAAMVVPALEVFSDRQSLDWGVTSIIEQCLEQAIEPLPLESERAGGCDVWLEPRAIEAFEWHLIVQRRTPTQHACLGGGGAEDVDALVWMDESSSAPPQESCPTAAAIDALFAKVDAAYGRREDEGELDAAIRKLIVALKADLYAAQQSEDAERIEAAIARARHVELTERRCATEQLINLRVSAAIAGSDEFALRAALRLARVHDCRHLDSYRRAAARLREVTEESLLGRLVAQLDEGKRDEDLTVLAAVVRVASHHSLRDVALEARDELVKLLKGLLAAGHDPGTLYQAALIAQQTHLKDLAERLKSKAVFFNEPAGERLMMVMQSDSSLPSSKVEVTDETLQNRIQELVDMTYRSWGRWQWTRDRRGEVPGRLAVSSVVKVENAESYLNYMQKRREIAAALKRMGSVRIDWGVRTDAVTLAVAEHCRNPVDASINEHYLWHGTTTAGAAGIADTHFDLSRAGSRRGSMFGLGLYFAESSMKSDEYAEADSDGRCPLLLCRVLCGNIYHTTRGGNYARVCDKRKDCYHSCLGDREQAQGTYREFVVFDEHQIYPEYIVWYTREELGAD